MDTRPLTLNHGDPDADDDSDADATDIHTPEPVVVERVSEPPTWDAAERDVRGRRRGLRREGGR